MRTYDFRGIQNLFTETDLGKVFDSLLEGSYTKPSLSVEPTSVVKDDIMTISYDLPGTTKNELEIDVEDQIIVVKGRDGRYKGLVSKVRIGQDYDMQSVSATLSDGVLRVGVAKAKKTTNKSTIKIT